ncbi:MAG TPA: N-acetylmuramoyl-L-alanine amidase, partial [Thermoanaerobaculia bacterium]|nr:N-acetylmuramoyl-L-alanine amidase [Thermoanaerobaculia bacterium]
LAAVLLLGLTGISAPVAAQGPPAAAPFEASFVPPEGSSLFIRSKEEAGKILLAVNDVAAPLGGALAFDASTRSYELKLRGHTAVFGTEAPIAVVDTKLVSLGAPVRGEGTTAFAEPEFFQKVLGPMLGLTIAWEKTGRILSAHKAESPEINVESSVVDIESTTKVVFRFSQPPVYRVETAPDQVVLHFPGMKVVSGVPERLVDGPRVLRVILRGGDAVVLLKEKGLATNVYPLGSPPRLVVDVTRAGPAGPILESGPPAGATPAPQETPSKRPEPKTVVLDPGHGGTEEGARGPGGLLEKEATLALVAAMKEALTRHGYRVATTRDTDASVGLEDRAASANAAHADVFLSIHCNASRTASAHGTEVYYLSLDASDRAAAALAESENLQATAAASAERNAALRDLDLILWDLAQNQHLAASSRLAEIIQEDFNALLGITTRGVKQAPFKVLIGVNAPAVLVEVAFISNPEEEKKLGADDFRRQTAETLAASLDRYFKRADSVAPVPYAPAPPGRR